MSPEPKRVASSSSPNLSLSPHHPLGTRELAESHRTAGVQLLRRDPHLGPEAELAAVDEPGRGVDQAPPPRRPRARSGQQRRRRWSRSPRSAPSRSGRCGRWPRRGRRRPPPTGSARGTRSAKSASVAGTTPGRMPATALSPRSSTPSRARAAIGKKRSATARCTSRLSAALQTPGRCVLALTTISVAMSRSADCVHVDVAVAVAVEHVGHGGVLEQQVDEVAAAPRDQAVDHPAQPHELDARSRGWCPRPAGRRRRPARPWSAPRGAPPRWPGWTRWPTTNRAGRPRCPT